MFIRSPPSLHLPVSCSRLSDSHWTLHFCTEEETPDLFQMHFEKHIHLTVSRQGASSGSPLFLWLIPPVSSFVSPPTTRHALSPLFAFSYRHGTPRFPYHNNPPLTLLAVIQATSPLPFLSLPHLSISARLGTAGVPLTTTLHWLLLMRNLPSSHLLDVHQRDTARDRQRACDWESFTDCILMECSY